ncbi:NIPSNAP family protein [Acidocella sp. KAb 2-4]|uniref:NIPSNAP family protein n=1 Tax=Acidocella sp. KAb 2-4 TaxID=2885158 RepID=UPI001D0775A6|nr:NIPSNAP family protein [Acidocella sp. KAb 2-4]MCB5945637.1 NIPSNAP family protein [Acidocella sp. KAb 2-4]
MYLHATLELSYAGVGPFLAMAPKLKAIVEADGWKLEQALLLQNGRLNTVIHIWRLRDMNHYQETLAKLPTHPQFAEIWQTLCEAVVKETVVFAEATPYA